jgi:hypothetical protein
VKRTNEFLRLIDEASQYLNTCQDHLSADFELQRWPRYDWDQETGLLVFSEESRPRVVAEIQFVGSISTVSDTWLWSWANDTIDGSLTVAASSVRRYGEQHGISQLSTSMWHAHHPDGWEMTSISALLTNAKGAYRTPDENGFTFLLLTSVKWAT